MKKVRNISWDQWVGLARYLSKYSFVLVIFVVFVFYNVVVVPKELPKKSQSSSSQSAERVEWDITTEKPEKTFSGVLQGRTGDWYRMGVSLMANRPTRIEITLSSVFSLAVSIGSLDIEAGNNFQYHEILFQIPTGMFSNIKFMLQESDSSDSWSYTGVKLSGLALSRLGVKNSVEADRLAPTLAGNTEHSTEVLNPDETISDSSVIFSSRFVAESDFIQSIKFNAKEKTPDNSYVLELREIKKGDTKNTEVSVKKVILAPGELTSVKDEWGNQSVILPARLESGKEYRVMLIGTGDTAHNVALLPLEGSPEGISNGKNIATITFGRYVYAEGGAMMSGARVEDFGGEILYTYSLSGEMNDFFNLFNTKGSVKFDTKKKVIVGKQQQHTSFTYRFFTAYPFQKFMLAGREIDNTSNEIKLEYSFDNVFWSEVPFTQEESAPQMFSLLLTGTGVERVVYVRVSYNGEDKKTGTFGLDQLSVRAELIRK